MKPPIRMLAAAVALSAWLILLLTGWAFGGAIHLLLVAALGLFPWREARASRDPGDETP